MLVSKQMHLHWEILKWLAIISLAIATAIVLSSQVAPAAGRPPGVTPALIPLESTRTATPITTPRKGLTETVDRETVDKDMAMDVWQTLDAHRRSDWEFALVKWQATTVRGELQVWRHIGATHAYLKLAQLDEAEAELDRARLIHPENALVRYFTGLLRLEQAALAEEWYEPKESRDVVFVSYIRVVPNTRSMFKLAAINELLAAIAHAEDIHADTALVNVASPTEAALLPTVGDFLAATGSSEFVGKAHNILSALYLENDQPEMCEKHLDATYNAGLTIVFGYTDLGNYYQSHGRHSDAARAFAKAVARQPGAARSAIRTFGNFRDAIGDIW